MAPIYSSIACSTDPNILRASLPLFETEKVEAIEWSFDSLSTPDALPDWFAELLMTFSNAGRLIGHGIFFSLFSGRWTPDQQAWLTHLKTLSATYRFNHVTEHFGFMTGANFHTGAPLSLPLTPSTLAIGQDRLRRIQQASECPVGLENLAFAYSVDDVRRQGDFLNELIEPVNGFIILDLHNLYCQSHNFDLSADDLLSLYPLNRVREIHLSGGSWSSSVSNPARTIRRDTHDDAVPSEVFTYLTSAIDHCPNLKYVVLEQLGSGLTTDESQRTFGNDFLTMDRIVQSANQPVSPTRPNSFAPLPGLSTALLPIEDAELYRQQRELSTILETASDYEQAQTQLALSSLAHSAWQIEHWDSAMLETAIAITQKWRNGFG